MVLRILNYGVRLLIVVLGIAILLGYILPPNVESQIRWVFGIIFILFGIYRLSMYWTQEKRYKFMDEDDE